MGSDGLGALGGNLKEIGIVRMLRARFPIYGVMMKLRVDQLRGALGLWLVFYGKMNIGLVIIS